MHPSFSIQESLKFGWEKTKEHSMLLFQAMLTLLAFEIVYGIVSELYDDTALGFIFGVALTILGIIIGTGFINITLKIGKGEKTSYRDIIPPAKLVWNAFLVSLLTGIVVLIGLILLIVPGIYFALRFSMARYSVLEGAGVMESLRQSTKMTEGVKWPLLGFFVVMIVLNILGAIPFGLGLLITVPVTTIAMVYIYEKLAHHHGHHKENHA